MKAFAGVRIALPLALFPVVLVLVAVMATACAAGSQEPC